MKLVYRCGNCAAQNEFTVLKFVSDEFTAEDVLAGKVPQFSINFWIRHPCTPNVHGIAPLVAIID